MIEPVSKAEPLVQRDSILERNPSATRALLDLERQAKVIRSAIEQDATRGVFEKERYRLKVMAGVRELSPSGTLSVLQGDQNFLLTPSATEDGNFSSEGRGRCFLLSKEGIFSLTTTTDVAELDLQSAVDGCLGREQRSIQSDDYLIEGLNLRNPNQIGAVADVIAKGEIQHFFGGREQAQMLPNSNIVDPSEQRMAVLIISVKNRIKWLKESGT